MNNNPVDIKSKVIFVTGAFGLIGKQICKAFLQQEAKVVLADVNSSLIPALEEELNKTFNTENYLILITDITGGFSWRLLLSIGLNAWLVGISRTDVGVECMLGF